MDGWIAFVLGLFVGSAVAVLWIGLLSVENDEKEDHGRRQA